MKLGSSNLVIKDPREDLCDSRWTYFDGSCYLKIEANFMFDLAKMACESRGATLAIPNTNEEFDFLKTLFDPKSEFYWVWCFIS